MNATWIDALDGALRTSPLQTAWTYLLTHYTLFEVNVYWTIAITSGVYWALSFFFLILDFYQWPKFLYRYKIQPEQNAPLEWGKFFKALRRVVFNQIFINFPIAYLGVGMGRAVFRTDAQLPLLHEVLTQAIIFVLLEEIGFYYSHRLFHSKYLYKQFHKIHHEWTAPIGMVATYAHPLEHVLSNLGPILLGPVLCNSHIVTFWLWGVIAIMNTIASHSGYHFPLQPSPQFHDYHHLKYNNNFGVLGILDRLHNTDDHFRTSPQYQNHGFLLGLKEKVPYGVAAKFSRTKSE